MKPIILLGEAWGQNEAVTKTPFCGASGVELLAMLNEASILTLTAVDTDYIRAFYTHGDPHQLDMVWRLHPEVIRMNVFNLHPPGNNLEELYGGKTTAIPGYPALTKGKFVRAEFVPELERLYKEIYEVDPNLVIALGNTPLWALCGVTGISKLRGCTRESTRGITGLKVLPTYHPAAVLRQWELRSVTVIDLFKAKREAEFPEVRRPEREIWIEPGIEDIERFYNEHICGCDLLSVDIETAGESITCIGFAPSTRIALVIPFYDARTKNRSYWPSQHIEKQVWDIIRTCLADRSLPKLFQNATFDVAFLWRSMGIKTYNVAEDTMLLHHALQPESLKGLGFLGSVYAADGESAWKVEHKHDTTIKRDA